MPRAALFRNFFQGDCQPIASLAAFRSAAWHHAAEVTEGLDHRQDDPVAFDPEVDFVMRADTVLFPNGFGNGYQAFE